MCQIIRFLFETAARAGAAVSQVSTSYFCTIAAIAAAQPNYLSAIISTDSLNGNQATEALIGDILGMHGDLCTGGYEVAVRALARPTAAHYSIGIAQ